MKLLLVLVSAIVVANALPHSSPSKEEIESQWQQFLIEFRSNELQSFQDLSARRQVFEANYRLIVKHNYEADNGLHSYRMGVNQFADVSDEEYRQQLGGLVLPNITSTSSRRVSTNAAIPDSIDWKAKGKVTGVKDQASCAGCWAFATTAGIESQIAINENKLVTLSEENLIDCSRPKPGEQGNKGCQGGIMYFAYQYIIANGGIDSESSYPYSSAVDTAQHQCVYKSSGKQATIEGFEFIQPPTASEQHLTQSVATVGPISCSYAATDNFRLYKSGVFSDASCSSTAVNHAVTVVGYGRENGTDYYLVKNSWGTVWGD
ncbi:unnamed protein product [Medioppia subpectinata]|uniref:Uncharacterized protein n=1 Tax=Medioppia subpectinata TaxID=1979941 RepID=A0A7R9KQ10_9ACAR|nr:unnamed protein product [Medioppia subpectinata]CAG2107683.1 unnamed protein product [Medioppia subpectinata]